MAEQYVAPINHGKLSAVGTTAAEAGRSGIKGLLKGFGWTVGLGALAFGGVGILAGASFGAILMLGVVGGVASGIGLGHLGAGIGALVGGLKGTARGVDRVSQERGAAAMLDAQVEAFRAQSGPQTQIYAPSATNHTSLPTQGTPVHQAGTQVSAAEYQGALAGQQLAAAR